MKNILVFSVKGGVGKSTIADEIAFSLARSGIPFNFYDLDGKGGTLHETSEVAGAEVSVVDTPGELDDDAAAMLAEADVVVIPTRPTGRDMEPLLKSRDIVQAAFDGPIVYVVNGWNRFNQTRDFLDWMREDVGGEIATVMQSEAFGQAWMRERSVVEHGRGSHAAADVLSMVNMVRLAAGIPQEGV